jgi:hypothetical protein
MKPKRISMKQAEAQVVDWNAKYPVGTPCRVYRLSNPREDLKGEFRTSTSAQLLGEMPVVWLDGVSGCWGLEALEPIEVPS